LLVLAAGLIAGIGIGVGRNLTRVVDREPAVEALAASPTPSVTTVVEIAEPQIVAKGPPVVLRSRIEAFTPEQKKALIKSAQDQKIGPDEPVGIIIAADGWGAVFRPENGAPERTDGKNPGSVDIFMLPRLPLELRPP
jgi:hypothetical protein